MPEWTDDLRARLAPLRLSPAREAEIVEELSQHLDQRYEELRRDGAGDADARRRAIAELREPETLAAYMRPLRQANVPPPIAAGTPRRFLLGDLGQDLRYAARMLRKQPGFTAAAVLTLALGIGANSAIFALVNATLLRPLPFRDPGQLVVVSERTETSRGAFVAAPNLRDWDARNATFDAIAGFRPTVGGMVMNGIDGNAETVPRQWVTARFFDVLGTTPVAGRMFRRADDVERASVVVLSESFWRTRFNGDHGIVGKPLRLDGLQFTVVGVAPDEAQLFGRTSMWAMVSIERSTARGNRGLRAIGRLKPGVTLTAADADMASVSGGLAREFPQTNAGRGVALEPMHQAVIGGELRRTSILFLGVVAFVLLVCCANVANLLLARATARTRELAVRTALGADRRRVIRQLLTESLLLSIAGGALGLGLGVAILRVAPAMLPEGLLPAAVTLTFDLRVVSFCAAAALCVGLLFGLAPAWQATAFSPAQALASGTRTTSARGGRVRNVLVAGEVATAVLLLFGAGLLLRTLLAVTHVDRGYRADNALTMLVDPLATSYPTPALLLQFYDALEREVAAIPGVQGVALATTLPLGTSYAGQSFFTVVGAAPVAESQTPVADYQIVSPSYFRTLDLPIVAGRSFDERDRTDGIQVCVVNQAFVRAHLNGQSPIGARVALRDSASAQSRQVVREIVGVARQVKGRPDETSDLIQIYVPVAQEPTDDVFMVVRPAAGRAEALAPAVRAAIARLDKDQLVSVRWVMTLDDIAAGATARYRFRAQLVVAFAALALLLAMVGLFGILAFSVQQRMRDIGVRRALGATAGDIVRLVVKGAAGVIAIGAAIGLVLALVLGRLLGTMLFGVEPMDPITFGFVALVLALTAGISTAGPAWRATRVDPIRALRQE